MAKALVEVKAEELTSRNLERWLNGDIPRRKLVVPFGGPIPSKASPLGVDLDNEWFDADTDLTGDFLALRGTRERLVDWHHDNDPTGVMKGAILGREVLDDEPESDGLWADWWVNAGERRKKLIADLERRGQMLYGSSQAVAGAVRKAETGHIDVWPLYRDTITTSPQNTYAVIPPLKALLTDFPLEEVGFAALKAALVGLDVLVPNLEALRDGDGPTAVDLPGKAGRVLSSRNEAELRAALDALGRVLAKLPAVISDEEALPVQ